MQKVEGSIPFSRLERRPRERKAFVVSGVVGAGTDEVVIPPRDTERVS